MIFLLLQVPLLFFNQGQKGMDVLTGAKTSRGVIKLRKASKVFGT